MAAILSWPQCVNGRQLPVVRGVQRDCHWGLKNGGNSYWSRESIMQWGTRQSQSLSRLTNHKRVMPANWRPCLIPADSPIATRLGLCSSLAPLVLEAGTTLGEAQKKIPSYQYRSSHFKDKMVSRQSHLYNGNPDTWKDGLYVETGPWHYKGEVGGSCISLSRPYMSKYVRQSVKQ